MARNRTYKCVVCGKHFPSGEVYPLEMVRDVTFDYIKRNNPEASPNGHICMPDYHMARIAHLQEILSRDPEITSEDAEEILQSFREDAFISDNVNDVAEEQLTYGQRLADKLSLFGGSWTFILFFALFLCIWMAINTMLFLNHGPDPYPYIFLNLILSCLAAIQAPIIMMSQNRREERDRLVAENDYKVNLKAEIQIRNLNVKFDEIIHKQWVKMNEIQDELENLHKAINKSNKQP